MSIEIKPHQHVIAVFGGVPDSVFKKREWCLFCGKSVKQLAKQQKLIGGSA